MPPWGVGYLLAYKQMPAYVEVWRPAGPALVVLEGARVSLGKGAANTVAIPHDPTVSSEHAVLEPVGATWSVRDVGSRNGTFVNGERIWGERRLRPGDEIRVGSTRLVFRSEGRDDLTRTQAGEPPPDLTRREREVLLALCRPVLSGEMFTEPASRRDIAEELVVTENAVKHHLVRLYDKFGIHGAGEARRLRLANEAIRRGAVSVGDLQPHRRRESPPCPDR